MTAPTESTTPRSSSSTRAAASGARRASKRAWSAAPTVASRSSTSSGSSADHDPDRTDGMHALRRPDLRRGVPRRRDQADEQRHRPVGAQAAVHRLFQLRAGLPVRCSQDDRRFRPDDEVRHVHRPHERRAQANVRVGVPESGAVVRHDRRVRRHPPGITAARLPVRPPGRPHEGLHRRRRRCLRSARRGRHGATTWLDDPFGLDDREGAS